MISIIIGTHIKKKINAFKTRINLSTVITFPLKYNQMDEKDKIIASLRKQLQDALSKNRALEQEVALLKYKTEKSKSVVNP